MAGAVVQLKDARTFRFVPSSLRRMEAIVSPDLRADTDYEVKADYNGMSSDNKRLSNFDTRKIAIVNLKLNKKSDQDKSK